MTNAVWLFMNWQNLTIAKAKEKTRQVVREYEMDFQSRMDRFVANKELCSPKLARYLKALAYQIPGNVVWSLRCPRYHPELCSDAAARLQSSMGTMGLSSGTPHMTEHPAPPESQDNDPASSDSPKSSASTLESRGSDVSSLLSMNYTFRSPGSQVQIHLGDEVRYCSLQCTIYISLTRSSICLRRLSIFAPFPQKASEKP